MESVMHRNINRFSRMRRRRGNAVLEAGLILPLLCWLVFGGLQFGYYFYVKNTFQGAAREGCRSAIVGNTTATVTQSVAQYLKTAGMNSSSTTLDAKFTLKIESAPNVTTNPATLAAGFP